MLEGMHSILQSSRNNTLHIIKCQILLDTLEGALQPEMCRIPHVFRYSGCQAKESEAAKCQVWH